jgi:hypothetical protein
MNETEVLDAAAPPVVLSKVKVYNPIEEGIALMLKKHGSVLKTPPDVSTPEAMKLAKANEREMVKFRTSIEAARKAEKEESLVYGRLVDSEAKRITLIAAPIEKAYTDAITAWETQEEARKNGHLLRIGEIRSTPTKMLGKPLADIEQAIEALKTLPADFQEFQNTADGAKIEALATLESMATRERELIAERKRLEDEKAERERVDGLRAKIAEITELLTTVQMCRSAERVKSLIDRCNTLLPDDSMQELRAEAEAEHARVLSMLTDIHAAKADAEKQAADLAQQKADQDKRDAELKAREEAAAPAPAPVASPIIVSSGGYSRRAASPAPVAAPVAAPTPAPAPVAIAAPAAPAKPTRPTDDAIIGALALHYRVHESKVIEWLMAMDLQAASARLANEFA